MDQLKHYFSDAYRITLDENPPIIGRMNMTGSETVLPDSHIALHRIETYIPPSSTSAGGWKIHGLRLYVHSDSSHAFETLHRLLGTIMGVKDEAGELNKPGPVFGILQWRVKIAFYLYSDEGLTPLTSTAR